MKNRKEVIFSIITVAIIIVIGVSGICVSKVFKSFEKNMIQRKQANLKDSQEIYRDIGEDEDYNNNNMLSLKKFKNEISKENKKYYKDGVKFLKEGRYATAIENLKLVNGNLKEEATPKLAIATSDYIKEVFSEIQPLINARHYLMAYEDVQVANRICENNTQLKNKIKEIEELESKNIGLTKGTNIVIQFLNKSEVNIQSIVGGIDGNYVTYSYPTGKLNFIIKEENGTVDGENGFLFLVEQMDAANGGFSKMNGYFYVFVNMDSGKAKIYDGSVLDKFKSTFEVSEFNSENPIVHKFTKEFTVSNCFAQLQQFLQEQDGNNNFVSDVKDIYNEQQFLDKVSGYKKIYNEPHQVFLVDGERYYVVTQEEIYEIQGNKLLKGGKPKFPEVKTPLELVL